METFTFEVSSRTWELLERYLSPEELSRLDRYVARLFERDLLERRMASLESLVRKGLVEVGASKVFALDIDELAKDVRGWADYVSRTGEPLSITVAGKPTLIVQDVGKVAHSAWDVFRIG